MSSKSRTPLITQAEWQNALAQVADVLSRDRATKLVQMFANCVGLVELTVPITPQALEATGTRLTLSETLRPINERWSSRGVPLRIHAQQIRGPQPKKGSASRATNCTIHRSGVKPALAAKPEAKSGEKKSAAKKVAKKQPGKKTVKTAA